jgi:hypothetical protein
MGENHTSVITLDNFSARNIDDPYTSNLNGALKYVGTIARDHKGMTEVGETLIDFANRIEKEGKITDSMRKEVHNYLDEIDILKIMEPNFFLD